MAFRLHERVLPHGCRWLLIKHWGGLVGRRPYREVKRRLSEVEAGHRVLAGHHAGQDVLPKSKRGRGEPMSGFQRAAECKLSVDAATSRGCLKATSQAASAPAKRTAFRPAGGVPQQAILACEVKAQMLQAPRSIKLGQDVVPEHTRGRREPMASCQHAAGCRAAGESCSQWMQPRLEGMRKLAARQH